MIAFFVVWSILGAIICANLLYGFSNMSKKQITFILCFGGPIVWALSTVVFIIAGFVWVWEKLK